MEFIGISRTFSTAGEQQYETIGAFWEEMSRSYGRENLWGLGYHWTDTSIAYAIGMIGGEIDGASLRMTLPDEGWKRVTGRTECLGRIYSDIYRDGPLQYEIERFDEEGNCTMAYYR